MICPRCQTANLDEHRYCCQCGARLLALETGRGATLREQMHHGLALMVEGEWNKARAEFESCIRLDPRHGASYLYLGLIGCLEGAPRLARDHLGQAVEIDPDLVNAWLLLGLMAESEEDFAEAERCFKEVVHHKSEAHLANQRLAFLAVARGDADEALPFLRAWMAEQERETAPLLHSSAVLVELGDIEEAAALLDRALALEPDAPALHRRRGDICRQMGQKQEAAAHYRAALAAEPAEVDTRVKYGITLVALGEIDGAISALEEAIERDPDRADAHYDLGVLYYTEKGELGRALAELDAALELDPADATTRMIRQELILERGRG
jgi:tetratricopeptide (TPR) repeat protein